MWSKIGGKLGAFPSALAAVGGAAGAAYSYDRFASCTADTPAVLRIVLTGGPCGGKSSSLAHFTKALEERGYDVYTAPEVPTILMTGGCKYPGNDAGQILIEFEAALMKLQTQLEDSFIQARRGSIGFKQWLAQPVHPGVHHISHVNLSTPVSIIYRTSSTWH